MANIKKKLPKLNSSFLDTFSKIYSMRKQCVYIILLYLYAIEVTAKAKVWIKCGNTFLLNYLGRFFIYFAEWLNGQLTLWANKLCMKSTRMRSYSGPNTDTFYAVKFSKFTKGIWRLFCHFFKLSLDCDSLFNQSFHSVNNSGSCHTKLFFHSNL